MQNPTKILLGSFAASLFLGDITFAAWGGILYAAHYVVTSWNAGKSQLKSWPKAQTYRTTWARAPRQEDQLKVLAAAHKNRIDRIQKSALTEVQKRALVARAEREHSAQIQNLL